MRVARLVESRCGGTSPSVAVERPCTRKSLSRSSHFQKYWRDEEVNSHRATKSRGKQKERKTNGNRPKQGRPRRFAEHGRAENRRVSFSCRGGRGRARRHLPRRRSGERPEKPRKLDFLGLEFLLLSSSVLLVALLSASHSALSLYLPSLSLSLFVTLSLFWLHLV